MLAGNYAKAQVIIDEQSFADALLPVGWTENNINFVTGHIRFPGLNSTLTSPSYDLSAYSTVRLTFDVAKQADGEDGPITVKVSTDGGATWTAQTFDSPVPTTTAFIVSGPTPITATGNNVKFRFSRENSVSRKRLRNIKIEGFLPVTATLAGTLAEQSLNGSTATVNVANTTYSAVVSPADFSVNNAPQGLSVASVVRNSDTQATLTFAFNNTDFDFDVTDFSVTVNASGLASGAAVTTNSISIEAADEFITTDVTSRGGLNYNLGEGPSAAKNFTVTATGLTPGGGILTIQPSPNYEVSATNATTGFGPSAAMPYTGTGTLAQNKFWVRLKSGLPAGNYNAEIITITGGNGYAEVTSSGQVIAPVPVNDLCTSSTSLSTNGTIVNGTLAGSTFTTLTNGNNRRDVWYSFTPSCTGSHTITVASFTGNVNVFLFQGACPTDNNLDIYRAQTLETPEVITAPLTAGTLYYIRVGAYDADANFTSFTISVAPDPVAPSVTAGAAINVTFNSATVPGTIAMGCSSPLTAYGAEYSTESGFENGTGTQVAGTTLAGTNFQVALQGLMPSTTYYYKTYAASASGTGYSTQQSFTTPVFIPDAPVGMAGSSIMGNSFIANWNTVSGAQEYRLDVSYSGIFDNQALSENFFGFTQFNGPNRSTELDNYLQVPGWTGVRVFEVMGAARIGSATLGGSITSPSLNLANGGGNATVKIDVQKYVSDNTIIQIMHSANGVNGWVQLGEDIIPTPAMQTYTAVLTGGTATSKIRIKTADTSIGTRFYLDNVNVTSSNTLPGYNDMAVDGTSQQVTGLLPGNSYFYRVRAVAYGNTSANSNIVEVITGNINIWNGTAWSEGTAPGEQDQAIIEGNYNTALHGALHTLNLTVNSGVFTVASGTSITVETEIVNNAGPANFIVENNASVLQFSNTSVNQGAITVRRNSSLLYRQDYTLWGAPVSGQNLFAFSPMTLANRFYTYNTLTDGYNVVPDLGPASTTTFGLARGYLIRMPNGDATPGYNVGTTAIQYPGSFTGVPNTGVIISPLVTSGQGYNLVANPYPSPIIIEDFLSANPGLSGTIYFWRKNNSSTASAYATATATDYVSNGEPGADDPQGIIQTAQGFIIQAVAANNVIFNNSMRSSTAAHDGSFFRQSATVVNNRVRLDLYRGSTKAAQMLVTYRDDATNGFNNGIDARFINDTDTALNSVIADSPYSIQGRAAFTVTDVVPLQFKAAASGQYSIALNSTEGLFDNQDVFLHDKLNDTVHDLKSGMYNYTSAAGVFNDRFEIVYQNIALSNPENTFNADSITAYKNSGSLIINGGSNTLSSVSVYDIQGRLLHNATGINAESTAITGLAVQQQVILIEIVTTENNRVSKKIVF